MIYTLDVPMTIEDNEAVRILEWHGRIGDAFAPGALVVELETHKALIEIRADQPGILRQIHFAEGDWCPLGQALALLSDTSDEALTPAAGAWSAQFLIC